MNADEARQYAKEVQHANKEARALGPLNKWLLQWCIWKINKEIRRATKRGRNYYMAVFAIITLFQLQDKDKLFLSDYYKSQGYHVELRFTSMDIVWTEERPPWFRNEKPWEGN